MAERSLTNRNVEGTRAEGSSLMVRVVRIFIAVALAYFFWVIPVVRIVAYWWVGAEHVTSVVLSMLTFREAHAFVSRDGLIPYPAIVPILQCLLFPVALGAFAAAFVQKIKVQIIGWAFGLCLIGSIVDGIIRRDWPSSVVELVIAASSIGFGAIAGLLVKPRRKCP